MVNIEVRRPGLVKNILEKICQNEAFICGGLARVACSPLTKPVLTSDVDVYLLREEYFASVAARIESQHFFLFKENDVSHVYRYAFNDDANRHLDINLIKPINTGHLNTFGELPQILDNFDFTVARIGVYLEDGEIKGLADPDFEVDEQQKRLVIKNIHCPLAEITRVMKYQKKGYFCPLKQVLSIFLDWDNRDDEFRQFMVDNLIEKGELSTEDIQELYKRLYID